MPTPDNPRFRVFATADIGDAAFARLRKRGYEVEVYPNPEPPPNSLIVEKVRSGIDGLITMLRDQIDAEVFAAGEGTLQVHRPVRGGCGQHRPRGGQPLQDSVHQYAGCADGGHGGIRFFRLGCALTRLWTAEKLVRENRWGFWHPYLPFLGDEMTGKTIGIIGMGRIGQALAKKCSGFDMNILCYQPQRQDEKFVAALQAVMDLRYSSGLQRERTTVQYVSLEDALRQADSSAFTCRWSAKERMRTHVPPFQRDDFGDDEADGIPREYCRVAR